MILWFCFVSVTVLLFVLFIYERRPEPINKAEFDIPDCGALLSTGRYKGGDYLMQRNIFDRQDAEYYFIAVADPAHACLSKYNKDKL